jgi:hypothetical protein
VARAIAVKELADVVIVDIAAEKGRGHCPRHFPGLPDRWVRYRSGRLVRLRGHGELGRCRGHRRASRASPA